jgi:Flp pilus assembly protein TadG
MSVDMRRSVKPGQSNEDEAQSLVETAVAMPLLLSIAFNIINFGYFWFVLLTMSAAPRVGAEYATQGGVTVSPGTTSVSNLVYDNMTNALGGATTANTAVRVCSSAKGVNTSTNAALCDPFGPTFAFSTVEVDPEAPAFVLNRVDVEYTVTPIIRGTAFNVILPSDLRFRRSSRMRSLY